MKKIVLFLSFVLSSLLVFAQGTPDFVCSTPTIATHTINATSAGIAWKSTTVTAAASYTLEYRSCSQTAWTTVNNLTTAGSVDGSGLYIIQNLSACQCYVVRIRANCSANEVSDWRTLEFHTTGCAEPCHAPSGLIAAARETMALLTWSAGATGTIYTVQWKTSRETDWKTQTATTNSLTINDLQPCNEYQFRVKSACSNTSSSEFSALGKFKTSGCVAPCSTPHELHIIVAPDRSYASLTWASTGARAYEVMYSISDGTTQTVTVTTNSFRLLNVASCKTYKFKVRSICGSTTSTTPVYSEWSADVSVNTEGCLRCLAPSHLSYVATDGSATLKWDAITGALSYEIQWKGPNDNDWHTVSGVHEASYRLTGLALCSWFTFRVKANCTATSSSVWSAPMGFKTLGCAPVCAAPRDVRVSVNDATAVISWIGATLVAGSYKLLVIREDGVTTLETTVTGNSYTLTGLALCKKYKVQVKAVCSNISVSEIVTTKFETRGCPTTTCNTPREVAFQVEADKVMIKWSNVGATNYYVEYTSSLDNATIWTRETTTGNAMTLRGLLPCKVYYFRIAAVCPSGVLAFTEPFRFTTTGCPTTCESPTGLSSEVVNDTEASLKFNLIAGQTYTVQYRVTGTTAWTSIALNAATTNNLPVRITGLLNCTSYQWRVLRNCSATSVAESNTETFKTLGCAGVCERTTGLVSEITDDIVAVVRFNFVTGQNYTVQYRLAGTTAWTSIVLNGMTPNSLPVRITGLLNCTTYQWRVLRNCSSTSLSESEVLTFKTKGCVTPCAAPRDLVVNTTTANLANFTWIMPATGLTYQVRYGAAADNAYLNATATTTTNNLVVLRELVACRYYVAQVRTVCANGTFSDWSTSVKFRVGENCLSAEPVSSAIAQKQYISDFGIYPNPGSEFVQVAYKLENEANVKIELINLQGQVVSRLDGGNQEVGNYMQTLDNLSNVHNGIYLVVIRANGKVVDTQKWQKQ